MCVCSTGFPCRPLKAVLETALNSMTLKKSVYCFLKEKEVREKFEI